MERNISHVMPLRLISVFVLMSVSFDSINACGGRSSDKPMPRQIKLVYPDARRNESVVDDYHGRQISDPYRWLENPDSAETQSFVAAQNAITALYFEQHPLRQKIRNRVNEIYNYSRNRCPEKHGNYYYYLYNSGLQNQEVLYVQDSLHGEPRVFFDPNTLSSDGTIAIAEKSFSRDGQYMAYSLTEGGSDWRTIKFKQSPSGSDLPDVLTRAKFTSMVWTHDNVGIFYNYYPEQTAVPDSSYPTLGLNPKVRYHRLGTSQSEDVLVMEIPDQPTWLIYVGMSDCGNYLLLQPRQGSANNMHFYYVDLRLTAINGIIPYVKLIENFDAEYQYITNEGSMFTFRTNLNASNYKLINIDLNNPAMIASKNWVTLVEEQSDGILEWAARAGNDSLILCYLRDIKNELHVRSLSSGHDLFQIPLDVGSIGSDYTAHIVHNEVFFGLSSFLTPGIIYRYDVSQRNQMPQVYKQTKVNGFDVDQYVTKQVFYRSKDGTKIPMFLMHRKDILLDGSHPAFMTGYGGFGASITPSFSVGYLGFVLHLHGIVASTNIRAEGSTGRHGIKQEQESINRIHSMTSRPLRNTLSLRDIRPAQTMPHPSLSKLQPHIARVGIDRSLNSISRKLYRLTIFGGSNGGLLMGASVNQRPDLFGCAIASVPVFDMLRLLTGDSPLRTEYGSSDKPDEFAYIAKYSPLHNIARPKNGGQYPAMLVLTGDHDTTALPLHSYKFIAELQHVMGKHPSQTNPLMLRVETDTGHLLGRPMTKAMDEVAVMITFMTQSLNLQWYDAIPEVLTSKAADSFRISFPILIGFTLMISTMFR